MKTAFARFAASACRGLGLLMIAAALAVSAHAGGPTGPVAPEIDPGSMGSALTLLVGGALWLGGKKRRA